MPLDHLREKLPAYARDISANLQALASESTLGEAQKWGAFLACAYATGSRPVIAAMEDAADLDRPGRDAARAAAAIEAMNNIYYRATNGLSNTEYKTLPPKLSMQALTDPGVDRLDYELWSLAVSAINGCAVCMDSHEGRLRKGAVAAERIQAALRIAAVVAAAAAVLDAEAAREEKSSPDG